MTSLSKLTNLIKKTGDKLVVVNEQAEPQFAIMSIADYENLMSGKSEIQGLTEEELLAKINRDISVWKTEQEDNNTSLAGENFIKSVDEVESKQLDKEDDEDEYYFEPVEEEDDDENF